MIPNELRPLLERVLKSIECTMQDAYNRGGLVCCGVSNGPECCGCPDPDWSAEDSAIMDGLAPSQIELRALLSAQPPEPQGEIVTVYDPDSRSYEEHEVGPITIVQHLDTKGSRKALGAMNAKLRCKVGHLERKIAQHRQQAGKLVEALRKIHFRADCFVEDDMDMRVPSIEAIVRIAGEALADWEKTQ